MEALQEFPDPDPDPSPKVGLMKKFVEIFGLTMIFDNSTSTTLDSENTGHLGDRELEDMIARFGRTFRMISLGATQPESFPVSLTPMYLGAFNSHGRPAITSTASAPPTPMAIPLISLKCENFPEFLTSDTQTTGIGSM